MDDFSNHYEKGNLYASLDKYQEAIDEYTAALALLPKSAHVLIQRSICKQKLGQWASSLEDAKLALEFEKRNEFVSNAWLCVGKAEEELGALNSAIDAYIKALEFNPNEESAVNPLERFLTNHILKCDPVELQKYCDLTTEELRKISLQINNHFVNAANLNRCSREKFERSLSFLKAEFLVNVKNYISYRAHRINIFAICYRNLLNFQYALVCMLVSYHLYKRSNVDTITITHVCNDIATCFNRQGNYNGTKTYLELAKKYFQTVAGSELCQNNKFTSLYVDAIASKLNCMNILGHAMITACRFEECIELELGAAKLAEQMDKSPPIEGSRFGNMFRTHASRAMSHVAKSYVEISQFDKAIHYYQQLLQHPTPFFNPSTTIVQWAKLALSLSEVEKFDDAIKCVESNCNSDKVSKIDQIELFTMITGIYENCARFAKQNGKEADAQKFYTEAIRHAQLGISAARDEDHREIWWFRSKISQMKFAQNGERNYSEMEDLTKAIEIAKSRNQPLMLAQ